MESRSQRLQEGGGGVARIHFEGRDLNNRDMEMCRDGKIKVAFRLLPSGEGQLSTISLCHKKIGSPR